MVWDATLLKRSSFLVVSSRILSINSKFSYRSQSLSSGQKLAFLVLRAPTSARISASKLKHRLKGDSSIAFREVVL